MKVLFPTDFSESAQNAFQHALLFADTTDSDIVLLHVVYPVADTVDIPGLAVKVMKEQVETAKRVMSEFIENGLTRFDATMTDRPNIELKVELGVPISVIKKEIEKSDIGLVIMGTKEIHNVYEKVIGTVSAGVISQVDCPVLIVPKIAEAKRLKCIVYATDVNEADPFEIWKTSNLLAPLNAIVRVLHVHTENETGTKFEGFERIKDYFEDHPISLQMEFHNLPGEDIEKTINNFMYLYNADLLVMYHPKRSFLDRLLHKSHTKKMASKTEVPLLVMKGFANRI